MEAEVGGCGHSQETPGATRPAGGAQCLLPGEEHLLCTLALPSVPIRAHPMPASVGLGSRLSPVGRGPWLGLGV